MPRELIKSFIEFLFCSLLCLHLLITPTATGPWRDLQLTAPAVTLFKRTPKSIPTVELSRTNPFPSRIQSFSFNFVFGIVSEHKQSGSHGVALVISPTRGLPGASSYQYLGLFNETSNGKTSNHVITIELDIHKEEEFGDIDDNHVGININGLTSVVSASAGYYDDKDGNFRKLSLVSGKVMSF